MHYLKEIRILFVFQGVHPRIITEGLELAKEKALCVLDSIKCDFKINRDRLIDVARTSLATKVHQKLANQLTDVVVDAILAVKRDEEPINLHMVEIMEMQHKLDCDTRFAVYCNYIYLYQDFANGLKIVLL